MRPGFSRMRAGQRGFSFVELVIVVVILGILSVVTMSRFLGSTDFNPIIVRDQVISMSRSAQQKAIGRDDVVLTIQPVANSVDISISDSTGLVQTSSVDFRGVALAGDVDELDGCDLVPGANAVNNAAAFVLQFDALGDLLQGGVAGSPGYPQAVSTGARLCINNDPVMSVCWSASGFAYIGDCIE